MTYTIIKSELGEFDIVDSNSFISTISEDSIQEAVKSYLSSNYPIEETTIEIKHGEVVFKEGQDSPYFDDSFPYYGDIVGVVSSLENLEQDYPELLL